MPEYCRHPDAETIPNPLSLIVPDWQFAGLTAALLLLVVAAFIARSMRTQIRRLTSALDHMSQGLCNSTAGHGLSSATNRFCACTTCPPA